MPAVKSADGPVIHLPRLTRLPAGGLTVTRMARAEDYRAVQGMHARCSAASRAIRYFAATDRLSRCDWNSLCDRAKGVTLLTAPGGDIRKVIAMTNILRTRDAGVVELAVLVEDAWQSRGLGSALASFALESLQGQGVRALTASVLAGNGRAVRMLRGIGAVRCSQPGAEVDFRLDLG
ncbi:GNAT family N-acetyltransferase [Kitasatospora kazusensis]|uniref:GNAT family N-acetyltransferase n=1 Tax=Kitasatospora kazusensis TaxID=407974 RepID=UPI0031E43F10